MDSLLVLVTEASQSEFKRGKNVLLLPGVRISGGQNVSLGNDCYLGHGCHIIAATTSLHGVNYDGRINIGNGFQATGPIQIIAAKQIIIEDHVLCARNVFICDCMHGTSRGDMPYRLQGFEKILPVNIGSGSWLGQNVVVLPGVSIGKQVVIGANSVVSRDIPDYCIAVGSPAKVIKRFDPRTNVWSRVE